MAIDKEKAAVVSNLAAQIDNDPLTYDKKGGVEATLNNIIWLLEHDPNLTNIKFNGLRGSLVVTGPVPWDRKGSDQTFSNGDAARLEQYLEREYDLSSTTKVEKALAALMHSAKYFDPVKDYFDTLPEWDGVERLDALLIDCFQAEDSDYTRAVTRKAFAAVVARQYEPGKKFDQLLILVGKQGTGKSSFFERITPMGAYTDNVSMEDLGDSKTAGEKIRENVIVEVPELSGMRKADIEKIKAFITRQEDQYRPAYGRDLLRLKRRCIIVGTTNNFDGFLRDTENRRFWPVYIKKTEKTMVMLTDEVVAQIWAEAKKRYQEGEKLYLETEELMRQAEVIQNFSLETNGLETLLREFLDAPVPANWSNWNREDRLVYWKVLHDEGYYMGGTGNLFRGLKDKMSNYTNIETLARSFIHEPDKLEIRNFVSTTEIWFECYGLAIEDFSGAKGKEEKKNITRTLTKLGWESDPTPKTRRAAGYGKERGYFRSPRAAVAENYIAADYKSAEECLEKTLGISDVTQ